MVRAVVPFAQRAGYARKAGVAADAVRLGGHMASAAPHAGQIPVLDSTGKLPASIGAVGPQGATGLQGPAGKTGDTGPPGPPGKNGATTVTVVTATKTGDSPNAIASCPPGAVATGGGWSGNIGSAADVSTPYPFQDGSTPTGWTATLAPSGGPETVRVYVVCASP